MKPILITTGEPAGVGPDICVLFAQQLADESLNKANQDKANFSEINQTNIVFCGDVDLLRQRAAIHKLDIKFFEYQIDKANDFVAGFAVLHIPCRVDVVAGNLNVFNSLYVLQILEDATNLVANGHFSALVTAPISKSIVAGIDSTFTGHTDFLAKLLRAPQPVMMLVNKTMRVALMSTHLPLAEVSNYITPNLIESVINVIDNDLSKYFLAGKSAKIAVCGLNPHAGENGYLGREEKDYINPTLENLRLKGINVAGALPADTLFAQQIRTKYDVIVAMYHDQGLAVIKSHGFGECVNVTLGLPIIRTSVDHGTAIDLAGKNKKNISHSSLACAVNLAYEMAINKGI